MSYKLQRDSDGVRYHGVPFETKDGKNLGGQISGGFTENEELRALLLNDDGSLNLNSVVTELSEVKGELEAIKDGTMQVRDDSLADKIDNLIERQESLESKLDSVIEDESVNARLTGSNVEYVMPVNQIAKYKVDTIVNAQTVDPGGNVFPSIKHKGESETHILFSIDVDNWWARGSVGPWTGDGNINDHVLYPSLPASSSSENKSYSTIFPSRHLYVFGGRYDSWGEAIQFTQMSDFKVYLRNEDEEQATVTIKVLRVWR